MTDCNAEGGQRTLKLSNKSDPPASFENWTRGEIEGEGLIADFHSLPNPQKDELVDVLLGEQGFLCSYCGRTVTKTPKNCHIDHFWPQAPFDGTFEPDRRLDHNNLFLSCGFSSSVNAEVRTLPRTCGEAKGNWFDKAYYIIPSDPCCEGKFVYDGGGIIAPKEVGDRSARNMIDNLNLNDPSLVVDRKKVVLAIEQDIRAEGNSMEWLEETIAWWRTPDEEGKLTAFAQVRCRYLEEEMRLAD